MPLLHVQVLFDATPKFCCTQAACVHSEHQNQKVPTVAGLRPHQGMSVTQGLRDVKVSC